MTQLFILGASTFVEGVDNVFILILGFSFLFIITITALMIYFMIRYNKKKHPQPKQIKDSLKLEFTWTIIPIILVLGMFHYGYIAWIPMKKPPEEGLNVTANARMWSFNFTYENGRTSDKLYVPVDSAVIVKLNSLDVLHSFYIPAFRVKEDMVPGLDNNHTWFEATKTGTYSLFCTEYCGLQHSYMLSEVVVMEKDEFQTWIEDTTGTVSADPDADPAMMGRMVVERNGCVACHSLDGSDLIGPTFANAWGTQVPVETDGEERVVEFDFEYLKRSVYEPEYDIHQGFRPGQMVSYQNEVSEEDLEMIAEFLKSLSE